MYKPTVSVIVPTFNRADTVREAIDSILAQTELPHEVIVVDDGSTDATPKVLAGYGPKIRAIRQSNGGAASARNRGIAEARGEWLAFLDSDDLWLESRMAVFYRDIAAAPQSAVAHVANIFFSTADCDLFSEHSVVFPEGAAKCLADPFDIPVPGPYLQVSALRAEAVRQAGGFDEELPIHEDTLLFRKLALAGEWLVTGDAVGLYRRLANDELALMNWETHRPVPFFWSRVVSNARLLEDPRLTGRRRQRVARDLSGAWFQLAGAHAAAGDRANARTALVQSVRYFPRPRAMLRALLPLVFGARAYSLVLGSRTSLRPNEPSLPGNGP